MVKRIAYITSFQKNEIVKEGKRFVISEEAGLRFITPKDISEWSIKSLGGLESYHLLTDEEKYLIDGYVFPGESLGEIMSLAELFKNTGYYFDVDFQEELDKIDKAIVGKKIVPMRSNVFKALTHIPQSKVEVLILGQDPYPRYEDAMGIAFSVPSERIIPSSLRNIITEVKKDLGVEWHGKGNLTRWLEDGILLLNTALTTEEGIVGAHLDLWKSFTIHLISRLKPKVSLLWGLKAQAFEGWIETGEKLKCSHPSGLSVSGFFGCKHFSKTNKIIGRELKWVV